MSLIVFDTEAESLNLNKARPWQISLVGENNTYNAHIEIPDLNVSKGAARVTRFSYDHHNRNARPLEEVTDFLWKIFNCEEHTFVAHNGLGYDIYIIQNLFKLVDKKLDLQKLALRFHDTLSLSRGYMFGERPKSKDKYGFLSWQYKMLHTYKKGVRTSLGAMCKEFEIEVDDSKTHDAVYDTMLNKKIYNKLAYEFEL